MDIANASDRIQAEEAAPKPKRTRIKKSAMRGVCFMKDYYF